MTRRRHVLPSLPDGRREEAPELRFGEREKISEPTGPEGGPGSAGSGMGFVSRTDLL